MENVTSSERCAQGEEPQGEEPKGEEPEGEEPEGSGVGSVLESSEVIP